MDNGGIILIVFGDFPAHTWDSSNSSLEGIVHTASVILTAFGCRISTRQCCSTHLRLSQYNSITHKRRLLNVYIRRLEMQVLGTSYLHFFVSVGVSSMNFSLVISRALFLDSNFLFYVSIRTLFPMRVGDRQIDYSKYSIDVTSIQQRKWHNY